MKQVKEWGKKWVLGIQSDYTVDSKSADAIEAPDPVTKMRCDCFKDVPDDWSGAESMFYHKDDFLAYVKDVSDGAKIATGIKQKQFIAPYKEIMPCWYIGGDIYGLMIDDVRTPDIDETMLMIACVSNMSRNAFVVVDGTFIVTLKLKYIYPSQHIKEKILHILSEGGENYYRDYYREVGIVDEDRRPMNVPHKHKVQEECPLYDLEAW